MELADIDRQYADVKTVEDSVALKRAVPRLKEVGGGDDRKAAESAIAAKIYALNAFLRLKNGMTKEEIFFTAENIVEELGGRLTLVDINVIIHKAMTGAYGDFYERLSCAMIMGWCRQYAEERMVAAGELEIREAREAREAEQRMRGEVERDPEMIKELRKLIGGKVITSKPVYTYSDEEYKDFKKKYLNSQK